MKKNFLKKLASVLSLALVVSSITPAASASAAATPNLAKRYANVYEGKSYAYTVKDAKGYTVKWSVSGAGAEYVNLSAKTGAKTTVTVDTDAELAAKNKNATVKASFYKGGKLVKSAGDVIKVKVSATGLGIVAADADVKLDAIPAGEVVDLNRTITPANATSITTWSVTDKDGNATTDATVDGTGNFKADKVGEYVVKAEAKNAKTGVVVAKAEQAVKVVLAIKSATQVSTKKLDVLFSADMKDAKAADFSIVNDTTKLVVAVKEIKVDGNKVTVETFADIKDGKTYTVKYKDISAQFTATDNKPASISITPATVEAEKATEIKVLVQDANGVLLSENPYSKVVDNKVDFTIETSAGYTDGTKLVLFKVGDTAKAKATYHTYEYVDGKEVNTLTAELTITAVDKVPVTMKEYKYTITSTSDTTVDFTKATLNDKIAVGDGTKLFHLYVKDSADVVATATSGYKLESSDSNVLLVSNINGITANVVAVKTGTAYVLVKDSKNAIVLSLPVNVVAERKAGALKLSTNVVSLSKIALGGESKEVTIELKDQYGDKVTVTGATVENVSKPAEVATAPFVTAVQDKITFNSNNFVAGTYNYVVKVGDFRQNVQVNVVNVDNNITGLTYALELSDTTIDTTVNKDTKAKDLTAKVAIKRGGQFATYANINSFEIKNLKDGKVVASGSALNVSSVSTSAIALTGNVATKNLEAGNYLVTVKVAKAEFKNSLYPAVSPAEELTFTGGFTVVDTQPAVSVKQVKNTTTNKTGVDAINDAFEFKYNGETVTANAIVSETVVAGSNTKYIKTVKVTITDGKQLDVEVAVNASLTVN